MSIDDDRTHNGSWKQANTDWKAMVANKQLSGIQIMASKGWQSQFVQNYLIKGISWFILIDPAGKAVGPSAPRPSDPELKMLLTALLKKLKCFDRLLKFNFLKCFFKL